MAQLVGQAAERLADILTGAEESAVLIDDIARANREQSGALEEVAVAVRQMDEMTQHNAALVEEPMPPSSRPRPRQANLTGLSRFSAALRHLRLPLAERPRCSCARLWAATGSRPEERKPRRLRARLRSSHRPVGIDLAQTGRQADRITT